MSNAVSQLAIKGQGKVTRLSSHQQVISALLCSFSGVRGAWLIRGGGGGTHHLRGSRIYEKNDIEAEQEVHGELR